MKTITVQDRQTIWDIAMQEYGSVEGVFELIDDNPGLTIDSNLTGGQLLKIKSAPVDIATLNYMQQNGIKPVSRDGDWAGDFNNDFSEDFFI